MLEKMASEGRIQNLLGYNEPDLAGQGNMNVSEALRLWPKYEELKQTMSEMPASTSYRADNESDRT